MKPPYQITSKILRLIASVSEKIGAVNSAHLSTPPTELRKRNRIRTIQSSLEIEGNTLTVEQITALLENKRIVAPRKDILEVKNAIAVYERLKTFHPFSFKSFREAHEILMHGLIKSPGKLRSRAVGIMKGSKIMHVAPPGEMVQALMNDLFQYLKKDADLALIKSCLFHYEMEFIHPFLDGNGRMGRLWQTLILMKQFPVFEFLPMETLIKERQEQYYAALNKSDKSGQSTSFVEFMLEIIEESLEALLQAQNVSLTGEDRIDFFKETVSDGAFTRQDYLRHYKNISSATASRDLKMAVEKKILKKTGDKRTAKYLYI